MEPLPDLTHLSAAEKDAVLWALWVRVSTLTERQSRLAKINRNSRKPPPSDVLNQPQPQSLRTRGGESTGGQPGHNGLPMFDTTVAGDPIRSADAAGADRWRHGRCAHRCQPRRFLRPTNLSCLHPPTGRKFLRRPPPDLPMRPPAALRVKRWAGLGGLTK